MNPTLLAADLAKLISHPPKECVPNLETVIANKLTEALDNMVLLYVVVGNRCYGGGHGEGPLSCTPVIEGCFITEASAQRCAQASRLDGVQIIEVKLNV